MIGGRRRGRKENGSEVEGEEGVGGGRTNSDKGENENKKMK